MQERIFAPITETSKVTSFELDEFAKRIKPETTVKGEGVRGRIDLHYAEIRSHFSNIVEHAFHQLRTDSAMLSPRVDN